MANIQKALDALQPYVIGIRYLEGLVAVDTVFKEGWVVPDDKFVKKQKGPDESINYYLLFSDSPNIGLDEILAYVDKTIKLNLEKEKKYDLLKAKVDELKVLFNKNTFAKLQKLKFTFDDELVPNINEFNLDIEDDFIEQELPKNDVIQEQYEEEEYTEPIITPPQTFLDENHNPLPLTDEEREMLEEEARAERNRLAIKNKKATPKTNKTNVELPPRKPQREVMVQESISSGSCNCGPDEACSKCIDTKY